MYINDHSPPHVHVFLRDGRVCIVIIATLQIAGKVAERDICNVLVWIDKERTLLLNAWLRYNP